MKKYKLIKALAVATPVTIAPLLASSCGIKNFDKNNLNTWGDIQKDLIIFGYYRNVQTVLDKTPNTTWSQWMTNSEKKALNDGFQAVNNKIDFNKTPSVITYTYDRTPTGSTLLSKVLTDGITYTFTGNGSEVKGSIKITFKATLDLFS